MCLCKINTFNKDKKNTKAKKTQAKLQRYIVKKKLYKKIERDKHKRQIFAAYELFNFEKSFKHIEVLMCRWSYS